MNLPSLNGLQFGLYFSLVLRIYFLVPPKFLLERSNFIGILCPDPSVSRFLQLRLDLQFVFSDSPYETCASSSGILARRRPPTPMTPAYFPSIQQDIDQCRIRQLSLTHNQISIYHEYSWYH